MELFFICVFTLRKQIVAFMVTGFVFFAIDKLWKKK